MRVIVFGAMLALDYAAGGGEAACGFALHVALDEGGKFRVGDNFAGLCGFKATREHLRVNGEFRN